MVRVVQHKGLEERFCHLKENISATEEDDAHKSPTDDNQGREVQHFPGERQGAWVGIPQWDIAELYRCCRRDM